jgi:hypothetical protein
MRNSPLILILALYAAIASIMSGLLFFYHVSLFNTKTTTYDQIKGTNSDFVKTPGDRLNFWSNFDSIVGKSFTSFMDFD